MGSRNRGRKALLQARFAAEINGRSLSVNLESLRRLLADPELGIGVPLDEEDWNWIASLAESVQDNLPEIRESIGKALENWTLDRLSIVARLILEQALGEMIYQHPPTPAAVVIDESIELARMFETDEVAGLVNGVLDSISAGQRK
ncbi:MAG: transcription antitermination factor NusB [Candidatus Fermentibacteraceae bacterium]|nr:transcription antitermination factor NusB [Candidatus Fermentibacteraceae bacterium]MBN2607519.1 transcription antitermination factor NusB [Candidatus Fermentibacteraceae bacterium]